MNTKVKFIRREIFSCLTATRFILQKLRFSASPAGHVTSLIPTLLVQTALQGGNKSSIKIFSQNKLFVFRGMQTLSYRPKEAENSNNRNKENNDDDSNNNNNNNNRVVRFKI